MKPSIFLDWFGVLADPEAQAQAWRNVEARLLEQRFGGKFADWLEVHDKAFKWFLKFWSRYGPNSKADYRTLWKKCEVKWMKRTLLWGGVEPANNENSLFRLDRLLTYQVTSRINSLYPKARPALRKMKRMGFRAFLVSNIDTTYARGTLAATGLTGFFEDVYCPEQLNAFKGSFRYWRKILRSSKSVPETSVVVDDRLKFLQTPARLGLKTILVNHSSRRGSKLLTIKDIGELPQALRGLFLERTPRGT